MAKQMGGSNFDTSNPRPNKKLCIWSLTSWVMCVPMNLEWKVSQAEPNGEAMNSQVVSMPDFDMRELGGTRMARAQSSDAIMIKELTKVLSGEEQLLERYADLQHVQLGKLQFDILGAISEGKLYDAPLRDLVAAFKILKDKELVSQGKPTEIIGLVGYLECLEKEERGVVDITPSSETQLDLFMAAEPSVAEEPMPCL